MKILKSPLAIVFYTERFTNMAGMTVGPLVFIRPEYRDDIGLLEHEKVHVRQFYRYGPLALMYFVSKKWRLRMEVEAYREQLNHPPALNNRDGAADLYASFLVDDYGLSIEHGEAKALILGGENV